MCVNFGLYYKPLCLSTVLDFVNLTPFYFLQVNWTPKVPAEMVMEGRLPDIQVPCNVNESKYCHVTLLDGSGLDLSFAVK